MKQHNLRIDTSKCIGCGICVKTCVAHNIQLEQQKAKTVLNDCIMCGHCTAVCPKEAISISGDDPEPMEINSAKRLNPQEVLDVIRFRRSVRQFQSRYIPKAIIDQILQAGRFTHTAKNMQDVSFVVLD